MIPAPLSFATAPLADWVELSCLKNGRDRLSRSEVVDQMARYALSLDPEDLATTIWAELLRRAYVAAYPFVVDASGVTRKAGWGQYPVYTMLALLGNVGQYSGTALKDYKQPAAIFEELVRLALQRYVGGRAIRIGHPRQAPVPKAFTALLDYLSKELAETLVTATPFIEDTKDCRADVVAWRPFADGRTNKLVIFAQCAIGANWKAKLTELSLPIWQFYIRFVVPPVRAFAIPFVEPVEQHWLEYGAQGGVALDRLRIVEMLDGVALDANLADSIRKWGRAQLKRVPWDA